MSNPVLVDWLVEDIGDRYSDKFLTAIRSAGIDPAYFKDLNKIKLNKDKYYLFNGSISTAEKLVQAGYKTNIPNFDNYLYSKYSSAFGSEMFNDDYAIASLSELNRRKFYYYGMFGVEANIFIRPDSGKKTFTGTLLDLLDFDKFIYEKESIKHDLVIISKPKPINGEWRFVVSKDGIISQSTYSYQGQVTLIPSAPVGATKFVEKLLEFGYFTDKLVVFDICESNIGFFHLLEVNAFCTSGLYACDRSKIVDAAMKLYL